MGKKDTITKNYTKDARIFADAFNYLIYGGRQVIDPQKLHPLDTTMIGVPYGTEGTYVPVQKYRDVSKYLTAMEDGTATYLLMGIENQSDVNYAMPVKNMVYDALQYAGQVEETANCHREAAKKEKNSGKTSKRKINSGEYLTGFYKTDRLWPVVTLVLFFGADRWDGPRSLHEMLEVRDRAIVPFVQDYRLHLIEPAAMQDEEIARFTTSLREVMLFIKYSKDKDKLFEIVNNDEKFKVLEQKAAQVINTVTGAGLKIEEGEETVDMCKAIVDMKRDAGREGEERGKEIGEKIGERNTKIKTAKALLKLGKLTLEEISESTQLGLEEVEELWKNRNLRNY